MRRTSPEIGFWSMQTQCVAALLITPDGLRVRCSYAKRFGEILSRDRKSTRLNSSHGYTSYAVFCLKKKTSQQNQGKIMRKGAVRRTTKETDVEVVVELDGTGAASIASGIGFLDNMLHLWARHYLID